MVEERSTQKDAPGFKVSDRRASAGGEAAAHREPAPPPEPPAAETAPPAGEAAGGEEPADFIHLVMSLAHTALFQLGDLADPAAGRHEPDLQGASRTIDILTLLKEKTRGNLATEEERLLEGALNELKVRFVAASESLGR